MRNLEVVYDEKISPLMSQIIQICKEHELPMFATFQFRDDPEVEGEFNFCTTFLPFKDGDKVLHQCRDLIYGPGGALAMAITIATGTKK